MPRGRSIDGTHPREVGVWEDHGEERTQPGPEDEQEFNRPEDTEEGLFGDETISVSGVTQCSGALQPKDIRLTGVRLQRGAGQTTEKPSLKRRLRSLA